MWPMVQAVRVVWPLELEITTEQLVSKDNASKPALTSF